MTDGFVWFDLILMVGVVTVALLTLLTRSLLNAVVFFIVFGLLLGIAWGRLNAVDIALAEVAIGVADERGLGALYFGIFRNARRLLDALGVPAHVLQVGAVATATGPPTTGRAARPSPAGAARPPR